MVQYPIRAFKPLNSVHNYWPATNPKSHTPTAYARPVYHGSILGVSPTRQPHIKPYVCSSSPISFSLPHTSTPYLIDPSLVISPFTFPLFHLSFHPLSNIMPSKAYVFHCNQHVIEYHDWYTLDTWRMYLGGSSTAETYGSSKPASTQDHEDSDTSQPIGQRITYSPLSGIKRQEEHLIGIGSQFDNGKPFTTLAFYPNT
jgi:hypothetical protein